MIIGDAGPPVTFSACDALLSDRDDDEFSVAMGDDARRLLLAKECLGG